MISKIKLKNFKVFKEEGFSIAPFTLITGINGMGKSSIIQSLLLLKQSFEINYLQSRGEVDLDAGFVNLETAQGLCYDKADKKEIEILIAENSKEYKWVIDATQSTKSILPVKQVGESDFEKLNLFNKDFIYLDAERWGPRKEYSRKSIRPYNTKLGIQGELTPIYIADAIAKNETITIPALKHSSQETDSLYENLNAWLSDILGLKLKARVSDIDEQRVGLSYNIEGSKGGNFSALQVGFGLTYSLPVILAPLISKPGDLIVIENPEAHLHPSAQVKIALLLALAVQNGVQVIIESHSDHILNSLRYSFRQSILTDETLKIIFIRSLENSKILMNYPDYIKILDKGKLSHRPADFFDVWDKMLTKLI